MFVYIFSFIYKVDFSWKVKRYCAYLMNEMINCCLVARSCIILYLSFKLRCYTRISSLKKSRNNTWKNTIIFYVCLISPISCCHLPFAPLGQVNEWTAKSSPFSIHGRLSEFFRSIAAKILKNPYRQWRSKFARRGGKQKFKITEKFLYWKLGPHFVSVVIQRMFSSWVRQRTLWFLFVVSILSFSFINKVDFSRQ